MDDIKKRAEANVDPQMMKILQSYTEGKIYANEVVDRIKKSIEDKSKNVVLQTVKYELTGNYVSDLFNGIYAILKQSGLPRGNQKMVLQLVIDMMPPGDVIDSDDMTDYDCFDKYD